MKLWLISQDVNKRYDTYDSAVVAAETEEAAAATHPYSGGWDNALGTWAASPDQVTVELLGEAIPALPAGVVLASFNAG